jgi:hypothetical protein
MDIITLLNNTKNDKKGFVVSFDSEMPDTNPLKKIKYKYIIWHNDYIDVCSTVTHIHMKTGLSWKSINKCLETGDPINGYIISYYK